MSTHLQGFQSFLVFLQHFVLAKLVTSSIRVKFNIQDFPYSCHELMLKLKYQMPYASFQICHLDSYVLAV